MQKKELYMRILKSLASFILMNIFATTCIYAASGITAENYANMKQNVESVGFKFTQTENNLDIVIDQTKLFSSIPALVADDVITKVTEKDLKDSPMAVTVYAAGITFSVTILSGVYAMNPKLDKVHVSGYIIPRSGSEKQLCYAFDYTRDMYAKLDMDKTSTNDFINNTPGFTFSAWCTGILEKEDQASSASKKSE
jgi:hypothetical protein